jgi:hypothetical protein
VRFIYFILVPTGVMRKAPLVIDLLMAELPTYVFFTIFTLMVLWWCAPLFVSDLTTRT